MPVDPTVVSLEDEVDDYLVTEEDLATAQKCAEKAFTLLEGRLDRLERITDYVEGVQDDPYMPNDATEEYRVLAQRAKTNLLKPALNAPAQSLFCENHRLSGDTETSPAWRDWQRNHMDARQNDLYREALTIGESFISAERTNRPGRPVKSRLLSGLRTVALWLDPVNDDRAAFVLNVKRMPDDLRTGYGTAFDQTHTYEVRLTRKSGRLVISLSTPVPHRFTDTPVVSYAPYRTLLGRAYGIIETLIPIQDRYNQTVFQMLVVQSYSAHKVAYVSGMIPPPKQVWADYTLGDAIADGKVEEGDPRFEGQDSSFVVGQRMVNLLDEDGNPIPDLPELSPNRLFVLEDPQASIGQLQESNLGNFVQSLDVTLRDLIIASQVSPASLTGSIANMSADAITALEATFTRMLTELQHKFGESHEQVLQLFAEAGNYDGADDFESEVVWRDMTSRSLAQLVDAWGKAVTMMGVPQQAAWSKIGATGGETKAWAEQRQDAAINYEADPQSNQQRSVSPANADLGREMSLVGG